MKIKLAENIHSIVCSRLAFPSVCWNEIFYMCLFEGFLIVFTTFSKRCWWHLFISVCSNWTKTNLSNSVNMHDWPDCYVVRHASLLHALVFPFLLSDASGWQSVCRPVARAHGILFSCVFFALRVCLLLLSAMGSVKFVGVPEVELRYFWLLAVNLATVNFSRRLEQKELVNVVQGRQIYCSIKYTFSVIEANL